MTEIKLCGLFRECDIEAANEIMPEYIGFVFAKGSPRYINPEKAEGLKKLLNEKITAVGVFVNEDPYKVAELLKKGVIDAAQLHGQETEEYIEKLRTLTDRPVIRAFRIKTESDIKEAEESSADYILLDSGAGTGEVFDWNLIKNIKRKFFLAGGLDAENVGEAVRSIRPFAVDVSSGIETGGIKDKTKMADFAAAVRA
ncbi:MAG: phosphoribosylanthranilate isomerase [Bacillota bacterium]|nr:phosphoribosylanthranilate isomerase [Bacillota bacterium]